MIGPHLDRFRRAWSERLDETRIRLARPDALLPLAGLGLFTGLIAGGVIVLFRLFVEGTQDALLPGDGPENYEALPLAARIVFPVVAALLLAAMFRWFAAGIQVLGVARVMERMAYHQGRCTVRAFLLQFFGAALAIIGGHSVGREGPHIFLGASSGSLLGQSLELPNNVIRALVGCGTAAGIAASFNTPLAGVIFALEVVMMEYTVASFIPVILAAVSATTLSNMVLGDRASFVVPVMQMQSLTELLLVLFLGVAAGAVSAVFIQAVQSVAARGRSLAIEWRMLLAGGMVGGVALFLPGVMGIGYDSVDLALHGEIALGLLFALLVGKVLATSLCIGLGVPGGVIGPTLFIGAMLGALVAELAALGSFGMESKVGFFALLGMGAMMSGSLQAPLAALTAMLELTDNPAIIMPGMLAVVVAGITASEAFGKDSLFLTMLRAGGLDYSASPLSQALRRIGVASVMERAFLRVDGVVSVEEARDALRAGPVFLVVDQAPGQQVVMPAADLARRLDAADPAGAAAAEADPIDLAEIPGTRLQAAVIELHANLHEARKQFEDSGAEVLLVRRMTAPGIHRIYGVLTCESIDKAYRR
ncbi:MAG: chloride channel protein [Chromatiaceae bacterium]|nr:chloride channel protein [Chromatiaceae bacterium]